MGIYLNPDNKNFTGVLKTGTYVDKTMMIADINRFIDRENKYICVSRPRRFGKTIAGNMLAAYYSKGADSRDLFAPLKIAGDDSFESRLNKYNVIKLDIASVYHNESNKDNMIKSVSAWIADEMKAEYPDVAIDRDDSLANNILRIYAATGDTFILILDEYDVLVREQTDGGLFNRYLEFLNGLFKSDTLSPAITFAYLTGILPIVRDKVQSKLNNFTEYTMLNARELTPYIGFTSDEVRDLCDKYGMDYGECRMWYDGYAQNGYEIYNPKSVMSAMENREYDNYWSQTSTYEVISDRIGQNFAGTKEAVISMLAGENADVEVNYYMNTMDSFKDKDDLLTYLIHVGYLAYDRESRTCRIPNREISTEWQMAVRNDDEYSVTNEIIRGSRELVKATVNGDEKAVAEALNKSHYHVTSNRNYNNEDALSAAIYLAYIYALNDYTITKEMTAGKGFADVTYIPYHPDIPAIIVELKHNKCPESALDQIRDKRYFESLSKYKGNLIFVGVNYDKDSKEHSCKIERFVAE